MLLLLAPWKHCYWEMHQYFWAIYLFLQRFGLKILSLANLMFFIFILRTVKKKKSIRKGFKICFFWPLCCSRTLISPVGYRGNWIWQSRFGSGPKLHHCFYLFFSQLVWVTFTYCSCQTNWNFRATSLPSRLCWRSTKKHWHGDISCLVNFKQQWSGVGLKRL